MNKKMRLIHCLDNLDNFNTKKYNELNIGIEIDFSDTNLLDGDWEKVVCDYQKKLTGFNNIISVHGVAFDLNPGSPDKKVVELTKYRYKQCIQIAKLLSASYVVFHSQINPWIKDKKVQEIKANRQVDFWHELVEYAGNDKLKLLIENVYENEYSDLLMLMEKINSPNVRTCLDTGHILLSSKISLDKWFENLMPFIETVHLHWNDGTWDTHQAPDDASLIIFKSILEKLSLDSLIALEYKIDDIEQEDKRIRMCLE